MLVLCTGMIRSGSTWSYNVCLNLLREVYPVHAVSGVYQESLDNWRSFASSDANHAVVKCHSLDAQSMSWLKDNPTAAFFIYTVRDPRECVASAAAAFNLTTEESLGSVRGSLEFLDFQRSIRSVCVVPYESIVDASNPAVAAIAGYLGLNISAQEITAVDQMCRRETLSAAISNFDSFPEADVYHDGRYTYHRPTLLHKTHFRTANAPGWPELLSEEQLAQIAKIFASRKSLFESDAVSIEG